MGHFGVPNEFFWEPNVSKLFFSGSSRDRELIVAWLRLGVECSVRANGGELRLTEAVILLKAEGRCRAKQIVNRMLDAGLLEMSPGDTGLATLFQFRRANASAAVREEARERERKKKARQRERNKQRLAAASAGTKDDSKGALRDTASDQHRVHLAINPIEENQALRSDVPRGHPGPPVPVPDLLTKTAPAAAVSSDDFKDTEKKEAAGGTGPVAAAALVLPSGSVPGSPVSSGEAPPVELGSTPVLSGAARNGASHADQAIVAMFDRLRVKATGQANTPPPGAPPDDAEQSQKAQPIPEPPLPSEKRPQEPWGDAAALRRFCGQANVNWVPTMSAATLRMLVQVKPTWEELEGAASQLRAKQQKGERLERGNVGIALRLITENRAAAQKKPVVMPPGYEAELDQAGLLYLADKPTREHCRRLFFRDVTITQVQAVLMSRRFKSWDGVVSLLTRGASAPRPKGNLKRAGRLASNGD